ncbi:hypothetical protein K466DRAFT_605303 [Polyporus arcularius HHB13444]|uniref:Domain of unknown function at the cortex 1 domain-containing protein n=1 Tax=Polyporus arcularius HHB13444 TaxID=1314778 RepID=A0A5C3NSZ7_9APHY|nr:hypothetical protein K466DRAFT_605303 [Polyporus arcularius HHB13444]
MASAPSRAPNWVSDQTLVALRRRLWLLCRHPPGALACALAQAILRALPLLLSALEALTAKAVILLELWRAQWRGLHSAHDFYPIPVHAGEMHAEWLARPNQVLGRAWDAPASRSCMYTEFVDPTLEHDLGSRSKPWALSPLIATMPYFEHRPIEAGAPEPPFPPKERIADDTTRLRTTSANGNGKNGKTKDSPSKRREYFTIPQDSIIAARILKFAFRHNFRLRLEMRILTTNRSISILV